LKKILLIEDELLLQKSLKKLLEKKGAEVVATSSGKEAIEIIQKDKFDKIICDLMLQDISGFDIIEESKVRYSKSEISQIFVIMTAYCSKQVLQKAANYGCKVLSKPFDDLGDAIATFLS